jgi:hypothetical protein
MVKKFAVKYSFRPEAQAEFYQSVEYYDERDDGWGKTHWVKSCVNTISLLQDLTPAMLAYHNFRKFKHTAIYRIIQDKRHQSTAMPMKEAA